MIKPAFPVDEAARMESLHALALLNTAPEERFDRITRMARRLFDVPIALISLVDDDRQWFKSCQGLSMRETAREVSFCAHAILGSDIMLVPDTLLDPRFHDSPLVVEDPRIRFYAGWPLCAPDGRKVGTLCLLDTRPRQFDAEEARLLRDLSAVAEQEIAAAELATLDGSTRLSNRRGFMELGQHALRLCARLERNASLACFDLGGVGTLEARHGTEGAGRVLRGFADLLMETFRDSDVVGRIGDDAFAVLMTNCPVEVTEIAQRRLRDAVARHNAETARGLAIRYASLTLAYEPILHRSMEALLGHADALMLARSPRDQVA